MPATIRRADYLCSLAADEEARAAAALAAGDWQAAERAWQRARRLRHIAYLRAAAAIYQQDATLNPEQDAPQHSELDPD